MEGRQLSCWPVGAAWRWEVRAVGGTITILAVRGLRFNEVSRRLGGDAMLARGSTSTSDPQLADVHGTSGSCLPRVCLPFSLTCHNSLPSLFLPHCILYTYCSSKSSNSSSSSKYPLLNAAARQRMRSRLHWSGACQTNYIRKTTDAWQ